MMFQIILAPTFTTDLKLRLCRRPEIWGAKLLHECPETDRSAHWGWMLLLAVGTGYALPHNSMKRPA